MSLCFFGRGYISRGGVKSSNILGGLLKKRRGEGLTDLELLGEARQEGVRSIFLGEADTLEGSMMDFQKMIYENVEKNIYFTINIYIYR